MNNAVLARRCGTMRGGAIVVQQAVGGARYEARQCTVARPSGARAAAPGSPTANDGGRALRRKALRREATRHVVTTLVVSAPFKSGGSASLRGAGGRGCARREARDVARPSRARAAAPGSPTANDGWRAVRREAVRREATRHVVTTLVVSAPFKSGGSASLRGAGGPSRFAHR